MVTLRKNKHTPAPRKYSDHMPQKAACMCVNIYFKIIEEVVDQTIKVPFRTTNNKNIRIQLLRVQFRKVLNCPRELRRL